MTAARDRNREAMPAAADLVDFLREHLHPDLRVEYVHDETTGHSAGTPPEERRRDQAPSIARDRVRCRGCAHRIPDSINPPQGLGHCAVRDAAFWPDELHHCDEREPE
ncbi:MAG: hypothetical protein ACLFRB_06675 [Thiohalorhabdus sp.]|uniref:hypothetical protein n=1 Tax=Thiohalorhabdus sp. TaxID=3094134 RepID=UPI00397F8E62